MDWILNSVVRGSVAAFDGNHRARQVYERFGYQVETVRYVKPIEQTE